MEERKKKNWLFWLFLALTIIWGITVVSLIIRNQYFTVPADVMRLNEIGDFLSGAFSPLALFWLTYGYWMQNLEIVESTKAKEKLKRAELIAAQPILEFSDCEIGLSIKDEKWEKYGILSFRIENHGATATKFSVNVKGCFKGNAYSEVLKEGKQTIDLLITLTEMGPKPGFFIDISYDDSMREHREVNYHSSIHFLTERKSPFECELGLHPTLKQYKVESWSYYDVGIYQSGAQWL